MRNVIVACLMATLASPATVMAHAGYPHEREIFHEAELDEDILSAGEEYANDPSLFENVELQDIMLQLTADKESSPGLPLKKPAINKSSSGAVVVGRDGAVFPVQGGAKIISIPGDPRSGGRKHQGVDLGRARGTPILAMWGGRVVRSYFDKYGGWAVKIMHPNGKSTYYAHMDKRPEVKEGQVVKQGQRLGVVGTSGNAKGTPPHLHLEVRTHSRKVLNPLTFIGGKRGQYVGGGSKNRT